MAYRILHALRRFAVSTAIRFSPVSQFSLASPEPRLRGADDIFSRDTSDDWMFDAPASIVAPAVQALSGELSRVSSALGELRELLSSLAALAPIAPVTVNVNEMGAPNFAWAEDILFDGQVVPAEPQPVAVAGDAAFLFEDDREDTVSWGVLRPSLAEFSHPA